MSNLSAWQPYLATLMAGCLPGCSNSNIFFTTTIKRLNIRDMFIAGQVTAPFYVVMVGRAQVVEGPLDAYALSYPVSIFGAFSVTDSRAAISGSNPVRYALQPFLLATADTLATNLAKAGLSYPFFVDEQVPTIDVSESNELNIKIYESNHPLQAFGVYCTLIAGETGA